MPRVGDKHGGVAESFAIHDFLTETEILACGGRTVLEVEPLGRDAGRNERIVHALRLGDHLVRALSAGHDALAFGMRDEIVVCGVDARLQKRARTAVADLAAENDDHGRLLRLRCFSSGIHDHEDRLNDREDDAGRKEDPHHDERSPAFAALLPDLGDAGIDLRHEDRVEKKESEGEQTENRADAPARADE